MRDRWMVIVVETNEMENQLLPGGCWSSLQLPPFFSLSIHPGSNYHQLEPLNPSSLNIAKTSVRMQCVSFRWHQSKQFFPLIFLAIPLPFRTANSEEWKEGYRSEYLLGI